MYLSAPGGERRAEVTATIDTGATHSTWTAAVMGELGISEEECEPVQSNAQNGAHSKLGYPPNLEAHLPIPGSPGSYFRLTLAGLFNVVDDVHRQTYTSGLLGRTDFLQQFRVILDERAQAFALEPYGDTERVDPADALSVAENGAQAA
jgi:hypothetical protein